MRGWIYGRQAAVNVQTWNFSRTHKSIHSCYWIYDPTDYYYCFYCFNFIFVKNVYLITDWVNIKSVGYNLKFLYRSYVLNY
jgi:hypothetical protein